MLVTILTTSLFRFETVVVTQANAENYEEKGAPQSGALSTIHQ